MKVELYNKIGFDIEYAKSETLDPNTSSFTFKKFGDKDTIKINSKYRYLAFKVPTGKGFSLTLNSRVLFELIQAIPKFEKYDDHDVYLFQVIKLGDYKLIDNNKNGIGGDADIEPPNTDIPIFK